MFDIDDYPIHDAVALLAAEIYWTGLDSWLENYPEEM